MRGTGQGDARGAARGPAPAPRRRAGDARVLVVEDDPDLSRLMATHLASEGYDVARASGHSWTRISPRAPRSASANE